MRDFASRIKAAELEFIEACEALLKAQRAIHGRASFYVPDSIVNSKHFPVLFDAGLVILEHGKVVISQKLYDLDARFRSDLNSVHGEEEKGAADG